MVEEIENPPADFPRWAYNLTAFSDLPFPHTYPPNLTDVIGAITSVSDIRTCAFPGRLVPMDRRIIQIKDLSGQEIQIILTGAAARKFDARTILDEGATESEVAIFVGTFVRNYLGTKAQYGNVTLSWYVNEDIPEINAFRASIAATPVVGGPLPDQFVLRRQFDGIIPHKTLDALIYPDLFANEQA